MRATSASEVRDPKPVKEKEEALRERIKCG